MCGVKGSLALTNCWTCLLCSMDSSSPRLRVNGKPPMLRTNPNHQRAQFLWATPAFWLLSNKVLGTASFGCQKKKTTRRLGMFGLICKEQGESVHHFGGTLVLTALLYVFQDFSLQIQMEPTTAAWKECPCAFVNSYYEFAGRIFVQTIYLRISPTVISCGW